MYFSTPLLGTFNTCFSHLPINKKKIDKFGEEGWWHHGKLLGNDGRRFKQEVPLRWVMGGA